MAKESELYIWAEQVFSDYLEATHRRKTQERFAILRRVYNYRNRFDAETLYADMQNEFRVSRATVYNTLELLLECNLVIKHHFENRQQALYQRSSNNDGGNVLLHLVCTECGRISVFTDKRIHDAIRSRRFTDFIGVQSSLYVYGHCKKCRKK